MPTQRHPPEQLAAGAPRSGAGLANAPVSSTLHLLTDGTDIHLRLAHTARPDEILAICSEAMRGGRVVEFPDALPPGTVRRSTVIVNFQHVSGAWVDSDT